MTRIFKAALYIPAYHTEGKKNPRHPCHPCLKDYLHAEGEPCSSATLVNYHLTKTYNFNEQTAYDRAKDRVEKLKGFYANLISYCCVIPILIIINLSTSSFQWFWFPMLGWGMGLTFHGLETFGYGKTWEEKKIQEILNKENTPNTKWKSL